MELWRVVVVWSCCFRERRGGGGVCKRDGFVIIEGEDFIRKEVA